MRILREWILRFWGTLRPGRHDGELEQELQAHLDFAADAARQHGKPIDEAVRSARIQAGGASQAMDALRDQRGLPWVDDLTRDLRYGVRVLRRQPGFAAVAVLTMALGISATTVLFSVAYGVLLKPLPWPEAERLVRVTETRQGRTGRVAGTVTNATYLAWREQRTAIEDIGGWRPLTSTMTGAGDALRVPIISTTPSLFAILRVRPLIGRLFRDGEGRQGDPGLVILSYGLWQERFGGRPEIIGSLVQLDDRPHTIVGVMPREFAFPDLEARAWTPFNVPTVAQPNGAISGAIFSAVARLRGGASPAQASAEATSRARSAPDLNAAATALFGAVGPIDISTVPELDAITADVRPAILILLAAAALLLITATANVASLQLTRATTRKREMAVRTAIGAGQGRIVRQLLMENAILGIGGGVIGLALAAGLQRLLPSLLPAGFPRLDAMAIDTRVLLFALTVSVAASVACGLVPAWHSRRVNLVETLSEDGVAPAGGTMRSPTARMRGLIMAGQVAIACVLLIGGALLTRSLVSLIRADRGYDPVNLLTASLPIPRGYPAERRGQLLETLVERLAAVPGVTHAAYSNGLPFLSAGGFTAFKMRSPLNPGLEVDVQTTLRVVSPGYFDTMRLRPVAGRMLSDSDSAGRPPAVVVNKTFAREYLGEHALGFRIPQGGPRAGGVVFTDKDAAWEVVGVVDDMRQDNVEGPPQAEIFASFKQVVPGSMRGFDPIVVVRTTNDPTQYVSTLRSLVQEEAPTVALDSVMTMEDRVTRSLEKPRLYAVVLAWFGAFALLIAGVGLFGVLSSSVAQRTREIGVRSALGARTRDIVALVLRQTLWIVGAGMTLGVAAGLAGVRTLSTFLYGVSPYDALTFVVVPIVIVAVAAVACLVPARRAARVDPLTALRT
jgi:putative ABC transport system permease protein